MTHGVSMTELLWRVASKGDREAFARLYRSFSPRIRAFLIGWGASIAQADDIIQEAMLTVWRKAQRFDRSRAGSATWVFTIARNRFIDLVRKQARPEPQPEDPAYLGAPLSPEQERLHDRQAVVALLATLPSEQAAALSQIYLHGKTYAQVALEAAVPESTVKTRVRLALRRLRENAVHENAVHEAGAGA